MRLDPAESPTDVHQFLVLILLLPGFHEERLQRSFLIPLDNEVDEARWDVLVQLKVDCSVNSFAGKIGLFLSDYLHIAVKLLALDSVLK